MNVPSLLVLFVGGWGVEVDNKSNLFYWSDNFFLSDLIATYPTICLESPSSLAELYSLAGSFKNGEDKAHSVSAVLQSHDFSQSVVADPDRYGHLTSGFHGDQVLPLKNQELKYVSFPPADSLKDVLKGSLPEIGDITAELLRSSFANVFYVAINNIWTIAKYKDLKLTKKIVALVNKKILDIVNKALDAKVRVLIVSDGGMVEDYIDLETNKVQATRTKNPLPCILVHKRLEGLKANANDIGVSELMPLTPVGKVDDIGPTILSLMGVALPKEIQSRVLFVDCIKQTFK